MYSEHSKPPSSDSPRIKREPSSELLPKPSNAQPFKTQRLEDKDGFVIPTVLPKPPPPKIEPINEGVNKTTPLVPASITIPSKSNILVQDDEDLVDRSFQVIPVVSF